MRAQHAHGSLQPAHMEFVLILILINRWSFRAWPNTTTLWKQMHVCSESIA